MDHEHIMNTIVSTSKKITLCETNIELDEEEKKCAAELLERKQKKRQEEVEAAHQRKLALEEAQNNVDHDEMEQEGQALAVAVTSCPETERMKSLSNLVHHFHGN